jgi:Lipid A 3-O-deacylase (PagL)
MQRVFPAPDFRNMRLSHWEKLVCRSALEVALVAILVSTMPLHAQSGSALHPLANDGRTAAQLEPLTDHLEPGFVNSDNECADSSCAAPPRTEQQTSMPSIPATTQSGDFNTPGESSQASSGVITESHERPDFNRDIYYRNRTEFGFEVGYHPINIPFVYDFALGDGYNQTPLDYTLVPIIASLRWHVTNIGGPWFLRGNFDFSFSGSVTLIPRGPESRYYAFMFSIRRNFVHRNWKVVPYFDERGGIGNIDAKEPLGVLFAQGQNLTFTYGMGAGVRYNFDSKYAFSAGINYMHISNGYLSEPSFANYGINTYGPIFGIDVRLGKPHHGSE